MILLSWERFLYVVLKSEVYDLREEPLMVVNICEMLMGKSKFLWYLKIITFDIRLSLGNACCQWILFSWPTWEVCQEGARVAAITKDTTLTLSNVQVATQVRSFDQDILMYLLHTLQITDPSVLDPTGRIFTCKGTLKYAFIYILRKHHRIN